MIPALWFFGAVVVWIAAAIGASKRPTASGIPLLLAGTGSGLCFVFFAAVNTDRPILVPTTLVRLLWSTILLTPPLWVHFSFRFGREAFRGGAKLPRLTMSLLWVSAGLLLLGGLRHPPIEHVVVGGSGVFLILKEPYGQLVVMHSLACVGLVFWNLHATLEAARASGCRHISLAIYSMIPMAATAFYFLAEALLYGQVRADGPVGVVFAGLISIFAFVWVLRNPGLGERTLPSSQKIVYVPRVLVALGICLVSFAVLAEFARSLGVSEASGWTEGVVILGLGIILALWVFPGLREEIQRAAAHGMYAARSDYRGILDRVDQSLASASTPRELLIALVSSLRATFGPLRVQLWIEEGSCGGLAPVSDVTLPVLAREHALRRFIEEGGRPLVLYGTASRVADVPLYLSTESLQERYGLRVFCPLFGGGKLIGVLGCGPAGGRTFHPEDIDLLERVASKIAAVLPHLTASAQGEGGGGSGPEGFRRWVDGVVTQARDGRVDPPSVTLDYDVTDDVDVDRKRADIILRGFLGAALDLFVSPGACVAVTVSDTRGDVIALRANLPRGHLILMLPREPREGRA